MATNPFASSGLDMFGQELADLPTSSKKGGPLSMLIGGLLQELGVGTDSEPTNGIAPPVENIQPAAPIAPISPSYVNGPVMPQLQNTQIPTNQPAGFDQAREMLKQQIKQSLGMK